MKRKEPEETKSEEQKKDGDSSTEPAEKKAKSSSGVVPELVKREIPNTEDYSSVQLVRLDWKPKLPPIFSSSKIPLPVADEEEAQLKVENKETIESLFPHTIKTPVVKLSKGKKFTAGKKVKVAVVFSGGQAAGGHNVVTGLYRYLKSRNKESSVIGFVGGPIGIIKGKYIEVTEEHIDAFSNMGGFHMLEAGRDKIQTPQEFESSLDVCNHLDLDGLVICGGDDSNTNASALAEYFKANNSKTCVIGAPKTIDGDLKNEFIEISFGFDSATKVFSGLIGNIMTDCSSAKKYYHFIRLMGREASHISLECAIQTHPNCVMLGEEVKAKKRTLKRVTDIICDIIVERARLGKNHGIILVPEGLIEFIPEMHMLLAEMNEILAATPGTTHHEMGEKLTVGARAVFEMLPSEIRQQMMADRDPHGNVQVSKIETERLLISVVGEELKKRAGDGKYNGKFAALPHFFGYEGRACEPSNFDSNYCFTLGHTIGALVELGKTGLLAVVRNLTGPVKEWQPAGIPVTRMLRIERRKGKDVPVIKKALVELDSEAFKYYKSQRQKWASEDHYTNPGGLQYFGQVADELNTTINLEHPQPEEDEEEEEEEEEENEKEKEKNKKDKDDKDDKDDSPKKGTKKSARISNRKEKQQKEKEKEKQKTSKKSPKKGKKKADDDDD